MRRSLILMLCFALCGVVANRGTTAAQQASAAIVAPGVGDANTARVLHVSGFDPLTPVTAVLLDPSGNETVTAAQTDGSGNLTLPLDPPSGGWAVGLYRAVVGTASGQAASATFVSGDGQPHLYAEPYLPSPTSAYNLVGIGLQPNSSLELDLTLTGGQGTHPMTVQTDADGAFSVYAWPEQYDLPFFTVGDNLATIPSLGLSVVFRAREHPVSANIHVAGPIVSGMGLPVQVSLHDYQRGRYVWGVYARMDGTVAGEFLAGPTDDGGRATVLLPLSSLPAGQYLIATPYDWGESAFTVSAPPATPTATPAPTVAATSTVTPASTQHKKKKHKHKKQAKP